jgi:hypothetical protein
MTEYHKKRYREDPEYRERMRATSEAWSRENWPVLKERRQTRFRTDPQYREHKRLWNWAYNWRKRGYDNIIEEYARKLAAQDGALAICRRKTKRRLYVDHCDLTKWLRGLLCHPCNSALGLFRHNGHWLRMGADYLDIWRIIHARRGEFQPAKFVHQRRVVIGPPSCSGPDLPAGRRTSKRPTRAGKTPDQCVPPVRKKDCVASTKSRRSSPALPPCRPRGRGKRSAKSRPTSHGRTAIKPIK